LSGYFGFKSDLRLEINEKWRGYKTLLYILSSNPDAKVHDISYWFQERENGESKIAKGLQFIRVYLTELILVKRLEIRTKKYKRKS
ncbi:MAG: dolichol-phosphate mannosyltransferase, partial [Candidatus Micrarchaeia archaeon]